MAPVSFPPSTFTETEYGKTFCRLNVLTTIDLDVAGVEQPDNIAQLASKHRNDNLNEFIVI
ncbi:MAG: hypothetical protein HN472_09170 [Nitrospina sp.]|nr:hypothetical protein [Nitrospina sp.]MBT4556105.1 hypothetical protein [Nitrospina sp.]